MRDPSYWMGLALAQARHAIDLGEIPVGAVVVDEERDAIVGAGCNMTLTTHDPSAHAEMVALRRTGQALENYRLPGLSMFVTLEPCPMCAGLVIHARLRRLVYGAPDPRTGPAAASSRSSPIRATTTMSRLKAGCFRTSAPRSSSRSSGGGGRR